MTCTEINETEQADLHARLGYAANGDRTRDVLHLSDIYKSLNQTLDPGRFSDDGGPNVLKMEVGILFESILERALAEKFSVLRPGEVVSDEGIWMSPDGVNPDELAVEEYKCTWMSSRHGVTDMFGIPHEKFQHWFWQIKGYCRALGVTTAYLTVLFVCGDYAKPIEPCLKRYRLAFSQDELEENWTMLTRHAREKGLLA